MQDMSDPLVQMILMKRHYKKEWGRFKNISLPVADGPRFFIAHFTKGSAFFVVPDTVTPSCFIDGNGKMSYMEDKAENDADPK
jgi:hypothetical protein